MTGIVAPGYGQDYKDVPPEVDTGKKKKKKRRQPDFDVGLDGQCHEFGGKLRTQHTPSGKPARSMARGPSISV
jgi:hypothetical protein